MRRLTLKDAQKINAGKSGVLVHMGTTKDSVIVRCEEHGYRIVSNYNNYARSVSGCPCCSMTSSLQKNRAYKRRIKESQEYAVNVPHEYLGYDVTSYTPDQFRCAYHGEFWLNLTYDLPDCPRCNEKVFKEVKSRNEYTHKRGPDGYIPKGKNLGEQWDGADSVGLPEEFSSEAEFKEHLYEVFGRELLERRYKEGLEA